MTESKIVDNFMVDGGLIFIFVDLQFILLKMGVLVIPSSVFCVVQPCRVLLLLRHILIEKQIDYDFCMIFTICGFILFSWPDFAPIKSYQQKNDPALWGNPPTKNVEKSQKNMGNQPKLNLLSSAHVFL